MLVGSAVFQTFPIGLPLIEMGPPPSTVVTPLSRPVAPPEPPLPALPPSVAPVVPPPPPPPDEAAAPALPPLSPVPVLLAAPPEPAPPVVADVPAAPLAPAPPVIQPLPPAPVVAGLPVALVVVGDEELVEVPPLFPVSEQAARQEAMPMDKTPQEDARTFIVLIPAPTRLETNCLVTIPPPKPMSTMIWNESDIFVVG
jgi:hypothetical protein